MNKRNQYEAYPITSLGKMTSSLKNGSFIFILPSFYEEGLKKERTNEWKLYHDNLYLGFTALDNVTNYECSREYHSGWWYPHALDNKATMASKESCTHHPSNSTNLNGVFDDLNPNQTTRTIAFCQMNDVNDCVKPKYKKITFDNGNDYFIIDGWNYSNVITYKLKTTRKWIAKRT